MEEREEERVNRGRGAGRSERGRWEGEEVKERYDWRKGRREDDREARIVLKDLGGER